MNALLKAALVTLLLTASAILPSQIAVKKSLQTPLGKALSGTCGKVLLPELIEIILSYAEYAHTCRENVPVYALAVLPDNTIAVGLANGEIHIIDPTIDPLQKTATVRILKEHTGPVTALKWLATKELLISGSTVNGYGILGFNEQADKHQLDVIAMLHNPISLKKSDERIILWNPASDAPVSIIHPQKKLSASKAALWESKYFQYVFFYPRTSLCKRKLKLDTQQHVSDTICECESKTKVSCRRTTDAIFDDYCIEGCADGTGKILLVHKNEELAFNCHTKPIRAIKRIEPGLFATAAEDGLINILFAEPRLGIHRIENSCYRGPVYALAVLHLKGHNLLVAGFADGTLQIYSFEIEESLKERETAINSTLTICLDRTRNT